MIKMSFGMIVFNGDHVLRENLETIYPFAHEIVVTEGPVKHYCELGHTQSTDMTNSILDGFPDPECKITVTHGQWKEKDEMCNVYAKYLTGDFVWHVDADEIYKPEDIQRVIEYLSAHPECYSMAFRLRSFYGGLDRYISGFEENFEVHRIQRIVPGVSRWKMHRPPTMIWPPTGLTCREMGHVGHMATDAMGVRIYHYSHVFPAQVKAKMNYYASWSSGIIRNYWERLYLPWMRATDEAGRLAAELPFRGVQEWTPDRRGDAFTRPFNGTHPDVIERAQPRLLARIEQERKALLV